MTAEYFNGWFADISRSAERQAIFTTGLGTPPEIGPSNGLPFFGLQELASLLALPADGLLVDVACGRGGPGMWLARSAGCQLVGVDFSAEAIRQATERRSLFGLESRASFQVGSLDATGVSSGSADAVVCIDAFQFSGSGAATAAEFRRVLRPGGRLVATTWEGIGDDEELGRLRDVDLRGSLVAAGFIDVVVSERREWHENARQMWSAVLDAGRSPDDPAMQSSYDEAVRSLARHDKMRRIIGTAAAP